MDESTKDVSTTTRPQILSIAIREKVPLYAAYMSYLKNGGIFIPTSKMYELGDEVYVLLTIMDDVERIPVHGKVVWINPANSNNNRAQGIGVEFSLAEAGRQAQNKIETVLAGVLNATRPTHTM